MFHVLVLTTDQEVEDRRLLYSLINVLNAISKQHIDLSHCIHVATGIRGPDPHLGSTGEYAGRKWGRHSHQQG